MSTPGADKITWTQEELPKRGTIVLTSDEPWSEIWHTQLHYAWQLSKLTTLLYLGPPSPWSVKSCLSGWQDPKSVHDDLIIFEYYNFLPASLGVMAMFINDKINEYRLNSYLKKSSKPPVGLLWQFDHFRGFFLYQSKSLLKRIYHLVDPATHDKYDSKFATAADLVVVTSPKFFDHYNQLNPNTIHIPQGVDLQFYSTETQNTESDNLKNATDSILLLGTLTYDVDYQLLHQIAKAYPGKLLVIGPDKIDREEARKKWIALRDSGLVTWLGPMSPDKFLPYLKACKTGIITYVSDSLISNNLRSPLKVINYLAAGKCVISNIDCEIPSLTGKGIYPAKNESDFFKILEMIFNNETKPDKSAVDSFLNSISYTHLITSIFDRINTSDSTLR